jgi:hypothetical protein
MRQAALEWDAIQQTRLRLNNMLKAFDRMERPYPEFIREFVDAMERKEKTYVRVIEAEALDGDAEMQRVAAWLQETPGLGGAVLCVLGLIPAISLFPNPAKLWAYLGLAVVDGKAVKVPMPPPPNNPRGPAGMHFSRRIRAYATRRVVDPIIKNTSCPYRAVYDQRRAHTTGTHPEWALEKNKAGVLTPAGHYYADAIRYTAKRVWRDVWNVAHGHLANDTQVPPVVAATV